MSTQSMQSNGNVYLENLKRNNYYERNGEIHKSQKPITTNLEKLERCKATNPS